MRLPALLALGAATIAFAGCAEGTTGAQSDRADPKAMVLRLSDLPRGYRVGDDSDCGEAGVEGASAELAKVVRSGRTQTCFVQFERLYARAPAKEAPPLVEAAVWSFASRAVAVSAMRLAGELLAWTTGESDTVPLDGRSRGEEAEAFVTANALVEGQPGKPGAALVWRDSAAVGLVFVAGLPQPVALQRAAELKRTQQERMRRPAAPPPPGDDREVALDNPDLGIDVYWLGRELDPDGPLPKLRLQNATGPLGPGGGPGQLVKIDYEAMDPATLGVTIDIWRLPAWRRFLKTELGRVVWSSPCASRTVLELDRGRAVVYAGYGAPTEQPCPSEPPDRYLAQVYLGDVVVAVNMPYCFTCGPRYAGRRADPYNSLVGMQTIARGLRLRTRTG